MTAQPMYDKDGRELELTPEGWQPSLGQKYWENHRPKINVESVGDLQGFARGSLSRLSALGDHIRGVMDGTEQPRTPLGRLLVAIVGNRNETPDPVIIEENPRGRYEESGIDPTKVGAPTPAPEVINAPTSPAPAVVDSPSTAADAAVAAMANGTATREQIQQFEQASIERLQERQERTGDGNISRALGVMNADGQISGNEYKVYRAIIEKSGIDLSSVGVSNVKDIDTTQELGKAIAAMSQQQSQVAQR